MNFGSTPGRILPRHPADEFLDFGSDGSSARGWSARPPAPIQPKSCTMPTHHGPDFTITSTSAQRDQTLRNAVQNNRSIRLNLGRGRLRFRTATCWRKARISRARSARLVKKLRTAVTKSRMNRSINFTLYHRANSLIPRLGRLLATDMLIWLNVMLQRARQRRSIFSFFHIRLFFA